MLLAGVVVVVSQALTNHPSPAPGLFLPHLGIDKSGKREQVLLLPALVYVVNLRETYVSTKSYINQW